MTKNRRNTYRCNSESSDLRAVLLLAGRRECPVDLLNQSAEGFSIAGTDLRLRVGQKARLRTNQGWSEVEVIRCSQEGSRTTLGLRRLEDLPDPRELRQLRAGSFAWRLSQAGIRGNSPLGIALVVGIYVALGFWALLLVLSFR